MLKECPKCKQNMIKLSLDHALDEKWLCTNPDCQYIEQTHHLEDFQESDN
jgi:ssDNA-binding Zn-finger/Zn-ribbon topoisomerase 1